MCRSRSSTWWPSLSRFLSFRYWTILGYWKFQSEVPLLKWILFSGSQWESRRDRRQGWGRVQHREGEACSATEAQDHGVLREVWIIFKHLKEVKVWSKSDNTCANKGITRILTILIGRRSRLTCRRRSRAAICSTRWAKQWWFITCTSIKYGKQLLDLILRRGWRFWSTGTTTLPAWWKTPR